MRSSKNKSNGVNEKKPRGKTRTVPGDSNAASDLPPNALTNDDPIALTTIFEPSKIKNFLYKVEPNMARINATSLDLVSTTATLLLKALVTKAVQEEQQDGDSRRKDHALKEDGGRAKQILLTSNRLKNVVLGNSPYCLDFLEETYENFRDKDGSFLPSKLCEYVPRTAKRKQGVGSAATIGNNETSGENNFDENTNKRLKGNHASSSLLLSSECANDATPIERAIANAATAKRETIVVDKIIEDDDDYD
mmetsp:Transcript_20558/g.51124  ORF Transcript_20558/g.51124 Transcript_20558/m.51124 type:complete len:250 (+) Transcript_20558:64-813(+)